MCVRTGLCVECVFASVDVTTYHNNSEKMPYSVCFSVSGYYSPRHMACMRHRLVSFVLMCQLSIGGYFCFGPAPPPHSYKTHDVQPINQNNVLAAASTPPDCFGGGASEAKAQPCPSPSTPAQGNQKPGVMLSRQPMTETNKQNAPTTDRPADTRKRSNEHQSAQRAINTKTKNDSMNESHPMTVKQTNRIDRQIDVSERSNKQGIEERSNTRE